MIEPKADTVRDFWAHMSSVYSSTVVPKASSLTMQSVAAFLDLVDIQDKDVFMRRFTTTVGRSIYIPFEIGVANAYYSLWGQIRVCVHEHQHVEQGTREGWLTFGSRYLTSTSYRAGYEAEAYGSGLEMEVWRQGTSAHAAGFIESRMGSLRNYGCSEEDIVLARQILEIRAVVALQGAVETKSAQYAITWLNEHAPELGVAQRA